MTEYNAVQDSGARQSFPTGAVRDIQTGKGRYDLLPPIAIGRLAKHYENGARKYGDLNYLKGIPLRRYLDSAMRHLFKFAEGYRDEDHESACVWNLLSMMETKALIDRGHLPASLNDLPDYTSKPQCPKPDPVKTPSISWPSWVPEGAKKEPPGTRLYRDRVDGAVRAYPVQKCWEVGQAPYASMIREAICVDDKDECFTIPGGTL